MATTTDIETVNASPFAALMKNAALRQLTAMVAIAASVAFGVLLVLWTRAPGMSPLYANLTETQVAEVVQALETAGITYKVEDGSGQVMVEKSERPKTRMMLAEQNLPSTPDPAQDLLGQEIPFGISDRIEGEFVGRARETAISRSIMTLQWVRSARVHIAKARESVFVRQQEPAKATVFLDVMSGKRLPRDKAKAIAYMVSSAIPQLDLDQVTVVDQNGNLLHSPNGNDSGELAENQAEQKRNEEQHKVNQINDMLSPILGHNGFKAQVSAVLDFSQLRETSELFDPAASVVLSEREMTSERRGVDPDGGVPGALNNQPPLTGQDPPPEGAQTQISESTDRTRNFSNGVTIQSKVAAVGELARLTIAVAVDNFRTVDEEGNVTSRPRTPEELAKIEEIVRNAVGFDAARGDTVAIVNSEFHTDGYVAAQPPLEFWQTDWFLEMVRQGIGLLLALVVFFKIIRPLARGVIEASTAALNAPAEALALPDGGALAIEDNTAIGNEDAAASESTDEAQEKADETPPPTLEERMDSARQIVDEDAERVAKIVKDWVTPDDE